MSRTRKSAHDKRPLLTYPNGEPVQVELSMPFESFGVDLTHLPFYRRPTAGDFEKGDGHGETGKMITILVGCTGCSRGEIQNMDARDFRGASEVLEWFLGVGECPEIGREETKGEGGKPAPPTGQET